MDNNAELRARLYVDGACSTNPGPMSIGVSACNELGLEFEAISQLLPDPGTNVIAEYEALLAGMELLLEQGYRHVEAFTDSELAVRQIHGDYNCRVPSVKCRLDRVKALIRQFATFKISYLHERDNQSRAHELAQAAFGTPEGKAAKRRRREQVTFVPDGDGGNAACAVS